MRKLLLLLFFPVSVFGQSVDSFVHLRSTKVVYDTSYIATIRRNIDNIDSWGDGSKVVEVPIYGIFNLKDTVIVIDGYFTQFWTDKGIVREKSIPYLVYEINFVSKKIRKKASTNRDLKIKPKNFGKRLKAKVKRIKRRHRKKIKP